MTFLIFSSPSLPCPSLPHLGTPDWGAAKAFGVGNKNKGALPVRERPTKNSRPWKATPRITACLDLSTPGTVGPAKSGRPGQGSRAPLQAQCEGSRLRVTMHKLGPPKGTARLTGECS